MHSADGQTWTPVWPKDGDSDQGAGHLDRGCTRESAGSSCCVFHGTRIVVVRHQASVADQHSRGRPTATWPRKGPVGRRHDGLSIWSCADGSACPFGVIRAPRVPERAGCSHEERMHGSARCHWGRVRSYQQSVSGSAPNLQLRLNCETTEQELLKKKLCGDRTRPRAKERWNFCLKFKHQTSLVTDGNSSPWAVGLFRIVNVKVLDFSFIFLLSFALRPCNLRPQLLSCLSQNVLFRQRIKRSSQNVLFRQRLKKSLCFTSPKYPSSTSTFCLKEEKKESRKTNPNSEACENFSIFTMGPFLFHFFMTDWQHHFLFHSWRTVSSCNLLVHGWRGATSVNFCKW